MLPYHLSPVRPRMRPWCKFGDVPDGIGSCKYIDQFSTNIGGSSSPLYAEANRAAAHRLTTYVKLRAKPKFADADAFHGRVFGGPAMRLTRPWPSFSSEAQRCNGRRLFESTHNAASLRWPGRTTLTS